MRGIQTIRAADPALAKQIEERGGFLLDTMIPRLIEIDRLMLVLVRCGAGRFLTPVQDVKHFVAIIEQHDQLMKNKQVPIGETIEADYIRDISLPA